MSFSDLHLTGFGLILAGFPSLHFLNQFFQLVSFLNPAIFCNPPDLKLMKTCEQCVQTRFVPRKQKVIVNWRIFNTVWYHKEIKWKKWLKASKNFIYTISQQNHLLQSNWYPNKWNKPNTIFPYLKVFWGIILLMCRNLIVAAANIF